MRIKCSFTLEPDIYENHSDAENSLREWRRQLQESDDSADVVRERVNNFHRQIYLSGLYLHNLAPRLPRVLSQNFTQVVETNSFFNLLSAVGVAAESKPAESIVKDTEPTEAVLSEEQWLKLAGLVETIQEQQHQATEQQTEQLKVQYSEIAEQQTQQLKAEHNESLGNMVQDNSELITQLAAVTASQELIISQLAAFDGQASTPAVLDESLLFTLQQNQTKALAQLKIIRNQVAKLSSGNVISAEKDGVPDLNNQLAKASRVKAKGLW